MMIMLTAEQETLLIPLYSKATMKQIIDDPTAAAIVEQVDYDFAALRQPWVTRATLAMRARKLDQCVREHPAPLVIHLGCGLDARADRVAPAAGTLWYDVDFPEVIELRRRFYRETGTRRMIGSSVTDHFWMDRIEGDGPAVIIAEGLLMYLREAEVKELVKALRHRFPGSLLAFDAFTTFVARRIARHPSLRKTGAQVRWGIDDPLEITRWAPGVELTGEWTLADPTSLSALGPLRRLQLKAMFALPAAKRAHRILRYRLGPGGS
ncbi:class I SAM-dependent methyltransferase [Nonomuraea sp. SYSU D8015]|uniref:class I SAM-dependent methyltransferase n=1 Tax=Nonomuraea sp. SYSU D8015 TaxID=2593644 RepID=UPI0016612028|nr:class I SAM-dependent methyltransferase [Nonomuraea sp. SYSU D8015]